MEPPQELFVFYNWNTTTSKAYFLVERGAEGEGRKGKEKEKGWRIGEGRRRDEGEGKEER